MGRWKRYYQTVQVTGKGITIYVLDKHPRRHESILDAGEKREKNYSRGDSVIDKTKI